MVNGVFIKNGHSLLSDFMSCRVTRTSVWFSLQPHPLGRAAYSPCEKKSMASFGTNTGAELSDFQRLAC